MQMSAARLPLLGGAPRSQGRHGRGARHHRLVVRAHGQRDAGSSNKGDGYWKGVLLGALAAAAPSLTPLVEAPPAQAAVQLQETPASTATVVQQLRALQLEADTEMQRVQRELAATEAQLRAARRRTAAAQELAALADADTAGTAVQPATMRTAIVAGGLGGLALYLAQALRLHEALEAQGRSVLRNLGLRRPYTSPVAMQGPSSGSGIGGSDPAQQGTAPESEAAKAARLEAAAVRAEKLKAQASELRGALEQVTQSLASVRKARQTAEAELARATAELDAQGRRAGQQQPADVAAAARQRSAEEEERKRKEAEVEAQWERADSRFQEVLQEMEAQLTPGVQEEEVEGIKERFLGVLDELHAERERAAALQYHWLEAEAELGRAGEAGPPGGWRQESMASFDGEESSADAYAAEATGGNGGGATPYAAAPAAASWRDEQPAGSSPQQDWAAQEPQQGGGWEGVAAAQQHNGWEEPQRRHVAAASPPPAGRQWNDPDFTAEVLAAFPDKSVASVEEARCLMERGGYTCLDVRPALAIETEGRVAGAMAIPWVIAERVYNADTGRKEVQEWENAAFMEQVVYEFPDPATPLIICDSDGSGDAVGALEALEAAGYTQLVGLKGGFEAWRRVFDSKGNRRAARELAAA